MVERWLDFGELPASSEKSDHDGVKNEVCKRSLEGSRTALEGFLDISCANISMYNHISILCLD